MTELGISFNPASIQKYWKQTKRKQLEYYGMYYIKGQNTYVCAGLYDVFHAESEVF